VGGWVTVIIECSERILALVLVTDSDTVRVVVLVSDPLTHIDGSPGFEACCLLLDPAVATRCGDRGGVCSS
jgi:hypothetical protein